MNKWQLITNRKHGIIIQHQIQQTFKSELPVGDIQKFPKWKPPEPGLGDNLKANNWTGLFLGGEFFNKASNLYSLRLLAFVRLKWIGLHLLEKRSNFHKFALQWRDDEPLLVFFPPPTSPSCARREKVKLEKAFTAQWMLILLQRRPFINLAADWRRDKL